MKPQFQLGEAVYLKTDVEQLRRIITGITERASGHVYLLTHGASNETVHYAMEISREKTTFEKAAGFKPSGDRFGNHGI